MSEIQRILDDAEDYYQSPKYLRKVEQLRDTVADIRLDLKVALDIEGTLASSNLALYGGRDTWQLLQREERGVFYVRRPFAKEMLDALQQNGNTFCIWTACGPNAARDILEVTGLDRPGLQIIDCLQNQTALEEVDLVWKFLPFRIDADEAGKFKIPHLFNIDVLADDLYKNHRDACEKIVEKPEESKKILPVVPFSIPSLRALRKHYMDEELLEVAKDLKVFPQRRFGRSVRHFFQSALELVS